MTRTRWMLAGVGAVAVALAFWKGQTVVDRVGPTVDFNRDVRPILNSNCVQCHGGVRRQGELSLLFRDDAMQAGKSGRHAIVPGDPSASELMRRITHHDPRDRMPKGMEPLPAREIAMLRRWIAQGAPWQDHWAFVAPVAVEPPAVTDSQWVRTPLDKFVLASLTRAQLAPSPEAECPTLARRVSIDLIGLPPTRSQVEQACSGDRAAGYARLVDTLLASPRFGERWATMWLDVARYADSKGYETDPSRPMWPYRDWVIRAFNRDLPFDQFTIEQLAGDLLPDPTPEQRIATAFHRNTMTNNEGGTDDEEYRVAAVIDRVNTTWEAWQGTSIGCAQCHGHPYDPIRHHEYYRAFALFNTTQDWDQYDEHPVLTVFAPEKADRGQALLTRLDSVRRAIDERVAAGPVDSARAAWESQLDVPAVAGRINGTSLNEVRRIVRVPAAERDGGQRAFMQQIYAEVADDAVLLRLRALRDTLRRDVNALAPIARVPVMAEQRPEARRRTRVFERGNFLVPTEAVQPGVPVAIAPALPKESANRLGLARALVDPANPLTARVTVNRFWEQLFGIGLVETSEDFGTQGEAPSHQDLLDWLAVRFQREHRWHVKALLRELVLSATYRQRSEASAELYARDPANRLLARGPRFRMGAEQIRDVTLAASGLLSERMYGPSVMPPQPDGVWQRPYSGEKWVADTGENRHRRALYTLWKRTAPYPSLMLFDAPSHEVSVTRRVRTNTPLQALVTLNDPVYTEAAEALARLMLYDAGPLNDAASVERALRSGYERVLFRAPSARTLTALRSVFETARRQRGDVAALTSVASSLLNLDAFLTKE
ncbi:MAG: PSD1 domain-containing protein [Gemmatimonadaceae bacterium]|nr:PSD1 domain-containing protein [Gemmatimonadaceae bacterium]